MRRIELRVGTIRRRYSKHHRSRWQANNGDLGRGLRVCDQGLFLELLLLILRFETFNVSCIVLEIDLILPLLLGKIELTVGR